MSRRDEILEHWNRIATSTGRPGQERRLEEEAYSKRELAEKIRPIVLSYLEKNREHFRAELAKSIAETIKDMNVSDENLSMALHKDFDEIRDAIGGGAMGALQRGLRALGSSALIGGLVGGVASLMPGFDPIGSGIATGLLNLLIRIPGIADIDEKDAERINHVLDIQDAVLGIAMTAPAPESALGDVERMLMKTEASRSAVREAAELIAAEITRPESDADWANVMSRILAEKLLENYSGAEIEKAFEGK